MDREQYEKDLKQRQKEHLETVSTPWQQVPNITMPWRPCLHDSCPDCVGTGVKKDGRVCAHCISCPCPKCTISFSSSGSTL